MLRGSLDTFSAGELLWLVGRAGVTGTLRVAGPTPGVVHCHDGRVAWATVDEVVDVVDHVARAGLVPADGDPLAIADQIDAEVRKGSERILDAVRTATQEAMFELASWDEGEIAFDVTAPHPLAHLFAFPIADVLDSVRHQRTRWAELVLRIGGADRVIAAAPADADEGDFTISRAQLRLLGAVDGRRDVIALARATGSGLVATAELVVALLDSGLLCVLDELARRTVPAERPVPDEPTAVRVTPLHVNGNGVRHLAAVPSQPAYETAGAGSLLTAVAELEPEPVAANGDTGPGLAVLARELGLPEADFVNAGDKPSRDLILRLLSAVKEL